jgi:hypothetical protein
VRRALAVLAAAVAALAVSAEARATPSRDAALLRRGLSHALQQHWLKPADAARYRGIVARATHDASTLPPLRARVVAAQLSQVTGFWQSYTSPRALALFTQLQANASYLETHRLPAGNLDITDGDGVVYRWFGGMGFEFHPLANFASLNNLASTGDSGETQVLAAALAERGIPRGGRLLWEYAFRFGIGRPPGGAAQAVAAQAFARASSLSSDDSLLDTAARAYAAVPPLLLSLSSGPWIRLYGFDSEVVLNAQLQTIVSLFDYARESGNGAAADLAQHLLQSTETMLPRFDTGEWSRYELGGGYATRDYQSFVTDLMAKVASATGDEFWIDAAERFHDYLYEPAQVSVDATLPTLYPQPADGFLDVAAIPVTLSQKASVTLAVAGTVTTWRLGPGQHVLTWKPPAGIQPGSYSARIATATYAGKKATFPLGPIVVQWDTNPPEVTTATFVDGALTWDANDPGTPSLDLRLDLVDPSGLNAPQTIDLGQQATSGTLPVTLPPGTWQPTTLEVTNSAGLTTPFSLVPAG